MSSYDPFTDDSAHVSVGHVQMRIGYLAHCLGIPAATLSALRSGEMVAVPREMTREMRQAFHAANEEFESGSIYPESSPDYQWRAMLAAAKDARHD